jgi:hypothetical protein
MTIAETTLEAVRREIVVNVAQERAFAVFTERFDSWWPRSHKIGGADMAEAVLEPRVGGRWYERDVDGAAGIRDAVSREGGWGGLLDLYAAEASKSSEQELMQ